jgi:hypothetical protein
MALKYYCDLCDMPTDKYHWSGIYYEFYTGVEMENPPPISLTVMNKLILCDVCREKIKNHLRRNKNNDQIK